MMTFVLIAGALALGFTLGWGWKTISCAGEVMRCSGRALAARVAVGQALPLIETARNKVGFSNFMEMNGGGSKADSLAALDQALHILRALTWGSGRHWRHNVRGTYYEVLTYHLNLQTSGAPAVKDGDELVLYIDSHSGRLSARHPVEFHDGRFTRVSRSIVHDDGPAAGGYADQDQDVIDRLNQL